MKRAMTAERFDLCDPGEMPSCPPSPFLVFFFTRDDDDDDDDFLAQVKSTELGQSKFMKNGPSLKPFCRSLVGQCKAMGIEVYDPRDVEEEGGEEEEEER